MADPVLARWGITVLTFDGERVYHFTMQGRTKPEELCAMLAYFDAVAIAHAAKRAEESADG